MINIDIVIVINRSVKEVWKSMTDPANAARWMSGLLEVGWISQGPWGIGTRFLKLQRFVGLRTHMVYDTIAYEPDRKLAYKTVSGTFSGPLSYEASITLVSIGSDTKLIYNGRGKLWGFFKLAEPIFTCWAKRRFEKDFSRLKELVEAQS